MKKIFLLAGVLCALISCKAQFNSTDTLHKYNNRWIRNSPVEAFSNLRLNTLLHGIIQWIDSARAGEGGSLGIDSVQATSDTTFRYRKNGVFHSVTLKGNYDYRRKVDSAFALNDSIIRFLINGTPRDVLIRGKDVRKIDSTRIVIGTDTIPIGGGSIGTAVNVGSGEGLYKSKEGLELHFKSLTTDSTLQFDPSENELKIFVPMGIVSSVQRLKDTASAIRADIPHVSISRTEGIDSIELRINNIIVQKIKDSTGNFNVTDTITNNPTQVPTAAAVWEQIIIAANPNLIPITLSSLNSATGLNTSKLYYITDSLKQGIFYYVGTGASQAGDNGGTIVIDADNKIWKRYYRGGIDPRWFGAVADGTGIGSPGGGDARAINAALAAAGKEELVKLDAYNDNYYYIDTCVTLSGGLAGQGGKSFNLEINANLLGAPNIRCFIVDGFKHKFVHRGYLLGPSTIGSDSTTNASATGEGIVLRNANDCYVEGDRINGFYAGIHVLGQNVNDSVEGGSQYNYIKWTQSRSNHYDLWLTIDGTPTNYLGPTGRHNWVNANEFHGRIGGGTGGAAGGSVGIKMEKLGGNSASKFESNKFYCDFEGLYWGIHAQFAKQNVFPFSRFEEPAITKKFYFRQDNTSNLSAPNNRILGSYAYEGWWEPGGLADGTTFTGTMYTTSSSEIGFMSIARSGRWLHLNNNDPATGLNETQGDVYALANLDGTGPQRFAIAMKRDGKMIYVPFQYGDTTTTAATFTVPGGYDMVYINREASVNITTFLSPASWVGFEITVKNIASTQNAQINNINLRPGDDNIIPPGYAFKYRSNNGYWNLISKMTAPGGGGGSGDVSSNTSTSVDGELPVYVGTFGKTIGRATGTGFAKLASGVLSTQSGINVSDINATGGTTSDFLRKDGTWATPAGGGGGSSQWSNGASSSIYYSLGSVNIGVNPSTPYAFMHLGPSSGTTKSLFEFSSSSVIPSAMRAHSLAYSAIGGYMVFKNGSGVMEKVLTENVDAVVTGLRWNSYDIHPDYIWDGSAPSNYVLMSNGTNGSFYGPTQSIYNVDGTIPENRTVSQGGHLLFNGAYEFRKYGGLARFSNSVANTTGALATQITGNSLIGQSYNGTSWVNSSLSIGASGQSVTMPNLSGSGTRMVVADASGVLSTQAIPSGSGAQTALIYTPGTYTVTLTNNFVIAKPTANNNLTINVPSATGNAGKFILIQNPTAFSYILAGTTITARLSILICDGTTWTNNVF